MSELPYKYKPKLVHKGTIEEIKHELHTQPRIDALTLANDIIYEKLHQNRKTVIQKLQQRIDKLERLGLAKT